MTIIGIPISYFTLFYKGFSMGYTIAVIVAVLGNGRGAVFIFTSLFLTNILAIPVLLAIAVSGIKIYKVIIKNKKKENLKLEFIRHTLTCLAFFNVLVICSFISGYVNSTLIEKIIKIL